ncbi:sulfite exporter TauE/SafE family protein [Seonamhaeicola sp.]|uniref:urease accessory protein UreH domain-containing protein n=1 Tax=Seonamhaeicola sp. TaxID=1912245 RepID=UPI00260AE18B|nr:sulfite exporter TauE/SafE family protein [Seonamhaeicola sp.]
MTESFPLFAGIIASILHVITGPDHLAAVLPFAVESKRKAWKVGLFWGIGHLAGMILIGVLFVLFKDLIPVDSISAYSEQLVGLVLIGIGVWAIYKIYKKQHQHKHLHVHSEDFPIIHVHEHDHHHNDSHVHSHPKKKQSWWASFSIGVLHGLAGIAHFLIFLPVLGFESTWDSGSYIVGFGMGTLIAMISFAFVIGKISDYSTNGHNNTFFNGIRLAAGIIAIVVGVYWTFAN